MSVEHSSDSQSDPHAGSRARDRSVVVSFTCNSETTAVAEAATNTDSATETPTHTDTDTGTDATRATRTACTDTHPHPNPNLHPHPHPSAQASSPITARFAGTSATRLTPARIERTRLRAQIAALQTELESRTDQQQELITQYERLLEAQQEAAEDRDEDGCGVGTTKQRTAGSGSVLKQLGTGIRRGRTRVTRVRRWVENWWRQLRR
ncbi:uncharacterized protein Nmag_1754 [Natrialba magadii ATCC 43099]|uniref:Uncharacterized protein n=1 Tax=Natrialba magadii (strain ATCC 43099 / DSM 3394 / CCM 3739 / CIP 104546 / IAM 13178 / JCM 8861 / NBRC 102185 / NCIMB 2190 / MS3) TaxID=547559 RepID=D3SUS0_NATMM|nr:hypothetical protein [Natrialba magadii]ADD05328.1 uncharacterized protein Nmag_1754 [Natrialba magadii ATCC 43099]ELY29354.1 hypothetical protein C500_11570 [Natrialba magadii ATCC 43099]